MHVSISMRAWLHGRMGRRCGSAAQTRARAASVSACVCACDLAPTHPRRRMRARSVGVDRGRLGSQAFNSASAFNANIGAWNTASVTTLHGVCAALAWAAHHGRTRSAGRWCDAGRCARRRRRCARAGSGVPGCRYSCAYERRLFVCISISNVCNIHSYI